MGYCTMQIDVKKALKLAKYGQVVSASEKVCFITGYWKANVTKASLKEDNKTIFFDLSNGDFVEYEIVLKSGQKIKHCGYDGVILEQYDDDLYDIRLESGDACVDIHDLELVI